MSMTMELSGEDIKVAIIKMLPAITCSLETNEKSTVSQQRQKIEVTPKVKRELKTKRET